MTLADVLLMPGFPHGTPDGYRQGCHGSSCSGAMPCRDVYVRYQGDWAFHRMLDEGVPLEDILAAEAAEAAERAAADLAAAKKAAAEDRQIARATLGVRPQVARLHGEGLNDTEIARKLGLSQTYVSRIRRELGLPALRSSQGEAARDVQAERDERAAVVARLVRAGKTDTEIADEIGWSRRTVGNVRRELGLAAVLAPRRDTTRLVLKAHAEKLTTSQIADLVGVGVSRVSQVLRAAGLRPNSATPKPRRLQRRSLVGEKKRELIAAAYAEGRFTDQEIADRLGMPRSQVGHFRRALGLPAVLGRSERESSGAA